MSEAPRIYVPTESGDPVIACDEFGNWVTYESSKAFDPNLKTVGARDIAYIDGKKVEIEYNKLAVERTVHIK